MQTYSGGFCSLECGEGDLMGGPGNDFLNGNAGSDWLAGGAGPTAPDQTDGGDATGGSPKKDSRPMYRCW